MVTTGLTWTDVTVKGRHARRGAWVVRAHGLQGLPDFTFPRNCLALRELSCLCCDLDQQGLLPGATVRHRRLRVGG